MKAKELLFLLGLKPGPRVYGHEVRTFELPREGTVRYAQWLHPKVRSSPWSIAQRQVDFYRTLLAPGDVVVDVGAHAGDTAVAPALAVGPTGCVLAFEPNRYVFEVLRANAALNLEKARIVPHCLAAAREDGKLVFEYGDPGYCNGGGHGTLSRWVHGSAFELEVDAVDLGRFLAARHADLLDRVRLVKVDTEGSERAVLESIRDVLARAHPYVKAEVNKYSPREERVALVRFLQGLGYRVRRIASDDDWSGPEIGEADVMAERHYDVFCTPGA